MNPVSYVPVVISNCTCKLSNEVHTHILSDGELGYRGYARDMVPSLITVQKYKPTSDKPVHKYSVQANGIACIHSRGPRGPDGIRGGCVSIEPYKRRGFIVIEDCKCGTVEGVHDHGVMEGEPGHTGY